MIGSYKLGSKINKRRGPRRFGLSLLIALLAFLYRPQSPLAGLGARMRNVRYATATMVPVSNARGTAALLRRGLLEQSYLQEIDTIGCVLPFI